MDSTRQDDSLRNRCHVCNCARIAPGRGRGCGTLTLPAGNAGSCSGQLNRSWRPPWVKGIGEGNSTRFPLEAAIATSSPWGDDDRSCEPPRSRDVEINVSCRPMSPGSKQTCYHPSLAALGILVSEWLSRTHQEWKLKLGMAWILAGIALIVIAIVTGVLSVPWLVAVLAFSVAGFGWTSLAIPCPPCAHPAVHWPRLPH